MKHILLVDDEESVVYVFQRYFQHFGYRVTAARDGDSAWAAFQSDAADCVLTDETMPGRSGSELAAAIYQVRPDIPVIIFSAYVSQIRQVGPNVTVLRKPVDPKTVVAMFDMALSVRAPQG